MHLIFSDFSLNYFHLGFLSHLGFLLYIFQTITLSLMDTIKKQWLILSPSFATAIQHKYTNWKAFLVKRLTGAKTLPPDFSQKVRLMQYQ